MAGNDFFWYIKKENNIFIYFCSLKKNIYKLIRDKISDSSIKYKKLVCNITIPTMTSPKNRRGNHIKNVSHMYEIVDLQDLRRYSNNKGNETFLYLQQKMLASGKFSY